MSFSKRTFFHGANRVVDGKLAPLFTTRVVLPCCFSTVTQVGWFEGYVTTPHKMLAVIVYVRV